MQDRPVVTLLLVLSVVATGCLGGQPSSPSEATIDPDDPPFRLVVDDEHAGYTYEVVWPDGSTTQRLSGGSLNITEPGNYTLRVVENGEIVAVHAFDVHHYELAGCNRDVLRVTGASLGARTHTETACADPSDTVDRPG